MNLENSVQLLERALDVKEQLCEALRADNERLREENRRLKEGERAVDTEMLNRYIDRCKYYESQLAAYENAKYNNWTVGNLRNELARQAERRMRIVSISERMLRGEPIRMPREIRSAAPYVQIMSNEDAYPLNVWVFRISREG